MGALRKCSVVRVCVSWPPTASASSCRPRPAAPWWTCSRTPPPRRTACRGPCCAGPRAPPSATPPPTIASSRSRPKPPLRFFFGPSRSASLASRSASAVFRSSLLELLVVQRASPGALPLLRRPYAVRPQSYAVRRLSRRSSSCRSRWTYGVAPATAAPAPAFAALVFCHSPLPSGRWQSVCRRYPTRDCAAQAQWPARPRPDRRSGSRGARADASGISSMSSSLSRGAITSDPVALGGERLLLQAADRQHLPGQRDLAGHRHVVAHRAPAEQRHERGGHRHAGARAVLRDRPGGHVDVEVVLGEPVARAGRPRAPRCRAPTTAPPARTPS